MFHATFSKYRGFAQQKATPPLGEKRTKIPGQDKLSRTAEEEGDGGDGEIFIARQILVQNCRGWMDEGRRQDILVRAKRKRDGEEPQKGVDV